MVKMNFENKAHFDVVRESAKCLVSEQEISQAYDRMAEEITGRLKDLNPLILVVMNGGLIPAGQLLPRLDFLLQLDYIHATRYRDGTKGHDEINWRVMPQKSLEGRHVLLIDDVLDEAVTLHQVVKRCESLGAAEVLTAVLADKQHDRKSPKGFKADFTGVYIEDYYAFGCGMDYKTYFRNIPGIYAVREDLL